MQSFARVALSVVVSCSLTGCGAGAALRSTVMGPSAPQFGVGSTITGFIGGVAADDPRAARVGQQVLAEDGTAADAAAAIGFALAVTLPSRAGLGGGGACIAYSPGAKLDHGEAAAIMFTPRAPAIKAGDRPAAVPMMARGLFALQARYGALPIEQIIAPAEQLARLGTPVSPAFGHDLSVVGDALLADPEAATIFGAQGHVLTTDDLLIQRDLGTTLARLRVLGARDMYEGQIATLLVARSPGAGGPISASDLLVAMPTLAVPLSEPAGKDQAAFLPPPADGGLAAAAAFQTLWANPKDVPQAEARALGAASAWRAGASAASVLADAGDHPNTLGNLPASTSFVTMDRAGDAVACAMTMGNLFGTGRVVPGTGILLAASPAAVPSPLLAAALAFNPDSHAFRAAVAGSGQSAAGIGVAMGLANAIRGTTAMPDTVPSPGRINAIACAKGLPGDQNQCGWATDPRGDGLAVGNN
jgi:gamma-glutamyltranspeptidase/glutathione hydrolase